MASNKSVAEYWQSRGTFGEKVDVTDPGCFACGYHGEGGWEHESLEQCHIIGASIGGSKRAENILLLCRRCHSRAPMTDVPEVMIEWVNRQDYYMARLISQGVREMRELGLDGEVDKSGFVEFLQGIKFDFHRKGCGSYADMSGIIATIPFYLEYKRAEAERTV